MSSSSYPWTGVSWVTLGTPHRGIAFQVGLFNAKFLGEKKVLAIIHANIEAGTGSRDNLEKVLHQGIPVPGWPRAAMGNWELRDA